MRKISRRHAIASLSSGFGSVALSGMLQNELQGGVRPPAKAKSVILLYMSGGVSQVDSFDPKPLLKREHGKPMPVKVERTQFNANGNIFGSPFSFKKYGESGTEFSEIFAETAAFADDIAVVRSMTSTVNEHAQGNFLAHTGFPFSVTPRRDRGSVTVSVRPMKTFPVMWCSEREGSSSSRGSGIVQQRVFAGPAPGLDSEGGFQVAGAEYFTCPGRPHPAARLDFVSQLDQRFAAAMGGVDKVEAAIKNYETAYRMQSAVPEICDISGESKATLDQYGINDTDDREMADYGKQALLARRLVEKGVRFIELSCLTKGIGAGGAANPWDQHGDLEKGHRAMAHQVDKPIAALIGDLKQRGLLDSTLLVFTGEFGKDPVFAGQQRS